MRKSHARNRARLWGAGAASVLTAASALVGATPAFALTNVTAQTPTAGPASGTITVTLSGMLTGVTTPYTVFTPNACTDNYAVNAANIAATTTRLSENEARITIPSGLSLASGVARKYNICIYASSSAGAAGKGQGSYVLTPIGAVSPTTGPSGGGNIVTFTTPSGSAPFATAAPNTLFTSSGGCPATYPQSGTLIATTATRQTTSQVTVNVPSAVAGTGATADAATPPATGYTVCFYPGTLASSEVYAQSSVGGYTVALSPISLNQTIGGPYSATPALNPNITATSPTGFLTGITTPAVLFSAVACPAVFPNTAVTETQHYNIARKMANNKLAVALPDTVTVANGTKNVCVYSSAVGNTGKLLGSSTYTPIAVPTLAGISPAAGSPLGGNLVTITGANLPTDAGDIELTLGGAPLTNITPINATTMTAVTPAHTQGQVDLTLTTPAGTTTQAGVYSFLNSISTTPNTAPNTASAVDLDVLGTGFDALTFNDTALTGAKVYLVDGNYSGHGANGARGNLNTVAACGNVLVVSPGELICTLDLTATLDAADVKKVNGYYTATNFTTTQDSAIISSASANFTKGDIGKTVTAVTASKIPNTGEAVTVVDVLSPTTLVMSRAAIGSGSGNVNMAIGTAGVTNTRNVTAVTSTTLTGGFTAADVGKVITSLGSAATNANTQNTVITSVNVGTGVATVAGANFTVGTVPNNVTLTAGTNNVPSGSYNLVVVSDSSLNAANTAGYTQSQLSSGSTFTVANY